MSTTSAGQATSASTETFVTALVFNAIIFGAEIGAFTLLRPYFPSIFQPRTYVPPKNKRANPLVEGKLFKQLFYWPIAIFKADYEDIRRVNGMDAYFFVRFLRMMVKILAPIWIVSWAVLLPVTSVNSTKNGNQKLDRFTFGNVADSKQERYAAHLILTWFFTGWILYVIKSEMRHYVITRQKYLINPERAASVQANTLLVTGIPARYLSVPALRHVFDKLPGGVRAVWINRNLGSLPETYDRQVAACNKLEGAETSLLSTRTKLLLKNKNGEQAQAEEGNFEVPKDKRPTHKLGFLGLFGEKVDSIDWARKEIEETRETLKEGRSKVNAASQGEGDGAVEVDVEESKENHHHNIADVGGAIKGAGGKVGKAGQTVLQTGKNLLPFGGGKDDGTYPPLSSAFIVFNHQIGAHIAKQALVHHEPYRMVDRFTEVSPKDVIWGNLGLNPYEIRVRRLISWAITGALIIFWAIPVAIVGAISNVTTLKETYPWLGWLAGLPPPVNGIIQGILPPVLLAVLTMLLPIVLRLLAQFEGIPVRTGCELSLMNRFFIFQVIHNFLIVTLASGIIASLGSISQNPGQIPSLLAENLPKASTFFLTYVILQGLSGTAGGFLQIVALVIYYVKLVLLGSTPRSVWGIKFGKRTTAWGTTFPGITLLTTIALGYMIISPIINGLAFFTFACFFMLYKYLFLWVYDFSDSTDTGGLFFPKAIQHLFVGLYVQHVCLAALFFLAQDENKKQSAIPEGALMVVLIVFTALFNILINNSYGPLSEALPLSLADKSYVEHKQEQIEGSNAARDSGGPNSPKDLGEAEQGKISSDSAVPINKGASTSAAPAPAATSTNGAHANGKSYVSEEDEYGFVHPAVSRPQRTIWIPKDQHGAYEREVKGCEEAGVDVSTYGAVMNEKGKVDVKGAPPDVRGWWEENGEKEE